MKEPVLILNANFAPIHVCTTRRAIVLVLTGKASLVMNGRGVIKTISHAYPRPSIIRLGKMIKRPRPRTTLNKREILRRDHYTCQYCGQNKKQLTLDHVIPRRLGGEHSWKNLVTACSACNHRKGGYSLNQVNMHLSRHPKAPPASAPYIFGKYVPENQEWVHYLQGW
jgi:5-methylcytosine-specific restriction endonuclease McrA